MGNPGQRLFEARDGGRLFSVGWQQVGYSYEER